MRVLLVSEKLQEHMAYRIANFLPRFQYMPCTVLWAKTDKEVEHYIQNVDAVLLNRCCHTGWLSPNSPVYTAPVPVARFYLDVWKIKGIVKKRLRRDPEYRTSYGTRYADFFREYDVRMSPCKELFRRACPEWISSMFWSPHCIDVQNYNVEKDIDVLFWGNISKRYTIRNEMRHLLKGCTVSEGKRIDDLLTMYKIVLNGRKYKFAVLGYHKRRPYHGGKLHKLISRAKICPTGPRTIDGVPIGKFFENAACGAISLTTDFTDREDLGFEHRKHLWITKLYRGHKLRRFLENLTYLLEHPDLTEEMSKNAKELIRTRHTPRVRGRELYEFLCKRTGKS